MAEINKLSLQKKEFKYRGKTLIELKELNIREFAQLLRSNEKRTALRQSDELQRFISRCKAKVNNKKLIKTHNRYLIIVPEMIGLTLGIYNGKEYVQIQVIEEMLGHRLGEFSLTRNKVKHGAAGIGATRSSASRSVK